MTICTSGDCLEQETGNDFAIHYEGVWSGTDMDAHPYFDKALSEKLVQFFVNHNASSVIDLGAGKGDYAAALMSKGIFTSCYDGNLQTQFLSDGRCGVVNLAKPINFSKHEWVLSLEVGEHLPKEYEVQFINNLHNVNIKGIVLSWAVVGQNGEGCMNCQNNDYIRAKFTELGYLSDVEGERELRKDQKNWFRDNLMVFVRVDKNEFITTNCADHPQLAINTTLPAVEVVLVSANKDFPILPYTINSVRRYLTNPITKFVLVSPNSTDALSLASQLGTDFVNENTLLELDEFRSWYKDNHLRLNHESLTWYYQQFLKLLYHKLSKSKYYYVIDSDIILKKRLTLVSDDEHVTYFTGYIHPPAHDIGKQSILRLLGNNTFVPDFTYIADMMCFNREIVYQLLHTIENRHAMPFYKAAILVEQGNNARFSEFELYGVYANYVLQNHKANFLTRSPMIRRRSTLTEDALNPIYHQYPYIAYHYWYN